MYNYGRHLYLKVEYADYHFLYCTVCWWRIHWHSDIEFMISHCLTVVLICCCRLSSRIVPTCRRNVCICFHILVKDACWDNEFIQTDNVAKNDSQQWQGWETSQEIKIFSADCDENNVLWKSCHTMMTEVTYVLQNIAINPSFVFTVHDILCKWSL